MSFEFRTSSKGIDITKRSLFSKRTRSLFPRAGTLAKIKHLPKKAYLTSSSIRIRKTNKSTLNTTSRRSQLDLHSPKKKFFQDKKEEKNPLQNRLFDGYVKYNHEVLLEKINCFQNLKHNLNLNFEIVKSGRKGKTDIFNQSREDLVTFPFKFSSFVFLLKLKEFIH